MSQLRQYFYLDKKRVAEISVLSQKTDFKACNDEVNASPPSGLTFCIFRERTWGGLKEDGSHGLIGRGTMRRRALLEWV